MSEDFATIVDAFIYAVKNTGDAKALIFEDKELTYHQYGKNATGIAAELASIGVKKGDRVA
ncbi:MAG: AMP-binding protein, partial [Rhodospirillales bacterium]|nr:AMP-binding protein [Rhodospirillales bacterium]